MVLSSYFSKTCILAQEMNIVGPTGLMRGCCSKTMPYTHNMSCISAETEIDLRMTGVSELCEKRTHDTYAPTD